MIERNHQADWAPGMIHDKSLATIAIMIWTSVAPPTPIHATGRWTRVSYGIYATSLAVDPRQSSRIYASYEYEISLSTDGGENWEDLSTLPNVSGTSRLFAHPHRPNTVYALVNGEGSHGYTSVCISEDGGRSWVDSDEIDACELSALAISSGGKDVLVVASDDGAFRSTDGGITWKEVVPYGYFLTAIVAPSRQDVIYLGGALGVLKSVDRGLTWATASFGLPVADASLWVHSLCIHPGDPTLLYAATNMGLFRAGDAGGEWKQVDLGARSTDLRRVIFAPSDPSIVYVVAASGEIYVTNDSGRTWATRQITGTAMETEEPFVESDSLIMDFDVDPVAGGALYAVWRWRAVFKSADGGSSWAMTGKKSQAGRGVHGVVADQACRGTVYGREFRALIRSVDRGKHWKLINDGLPVYRNRDWVYVEDLQGDPTRNRVLYALTDAGVYRSENRGGSWEAAEPELPREDQVLGMTVDPSDADHLVEWVKSGAIYETHDGADSWRFVSGGPAAVAFSTLTIHPRQPRVWYAATSDPCQAYRSSDSGKTWVRFGSEMPGRYGCSSVVQLAPDP